MICFRNLKCKNFDGLQQVEEDNPVQETGTVPTQAVELPTLDIEPNVSNVKLQSLAVATLAVVVSEAVGTIGLVVVDLAAEVAEAAWHLALTKNH